MTAKWLKPIGQCCVCGKLGAGTLMNSRNDPIGTFCRKCADKRIAADNAPERRTTP